MGRQIYAHSSQEEIVGSYSHRTAHVQKISMFNLKTIAYQGLIYKAKPGRTLSLTVLSILLP